MSIRGHCLVDGYNLAHAWPEMRAQLKARGAAAADALVARLRAIHDSGGQDLTVVFDGSGPEITIDHPGGEERFAVVYSPKGLTADAVIEQLLSKTPSTEGWKVATDDRALAQTALSYGADVLSAEQTLEWLERLEGATAGWLERHRSSNDRQWRKGRS